MAAERELLEETNLKGKVKHMIGTRSHFNTIFGDILLIGMEMQISKWTQMVPGDDAAETVLYSLDKLPKLAFTCHENIVKMYNKKTYCETRTYL